MKKDFTCILTTTINVPYFLDNLLKNIKKFKHRNTYVLVIADKKKPIAAKNYFDTFYKLVKKCIYETNNKINKISKIQEKNKVRHYQSISSFEIRKRNISNLRYIKDYFNGYIIWLDAIKKI